LHGGCSYGQARVRWFRLYCGRCSWDLEQACVRRFRLRMYCGRCSLALEQACVRRFRLRVYSLCMYYGRYLHVDGNLLFLRLYMYLWHSKR